MNISKMSKFNLNKSSIFFLLTLSLSLANSKYISNYERTYRKINSGGGIDEVIGGIVSGEISPESQLVSHLNEETNEISDENSEIKSKVEREGGTRKKKKFHTHLPTYLRLIDEQLKLSKESGGEIDTLFGEVKGPLAKAWLPIEIKREETLEKRRSTSIIFQQTQSREMLGDFLKAELILTMKPDAKFSDDGRAFVRILLDGIAESKSLSKSKTFYTFNITQFLQRTLALQLEHPNQISIHFELHNYANSLFLDELFDVQVERPFIMFLYKEISRSFETASHEFKSDRKKRSLSEPLENPEPNNSLDSPSKQNNSSLSDSQMEIIANQKNDKTFERINSNENSSAPSTTTNITSLNRVNCSDPSQNPSGLLKDCVPSLGVNNAKVDSANAKSTSGETQNIGELLNLCRNIEWSVDVEDIDWSEVVSHKKIDIGYCSGTCPFPLENDHYNFTLHSYFIDKFRRNKHFDIPQNFPRSCCIPITYKPIRVWQEEDENIFANVEYDNVIVESCGCR